MSTNTTRTGQPSQRHLLDKIVDALIRRHNIVKGDLTCEYQGEAVPWNAGWQGGIEQIALAKAMTLSAETLGCIIAAEPNAALYNVHCGTWLGKYESGPYLLQQIAATAMVCRIRAKLLGERYGVKYYTSHQTGQAA